MAVFLKVGSKGVSRDAILSLSAPLHGPPLLYFLRHSRSGPARHVAVPSLQSRSRTLVIHARSVGSLWPSASNRTLIKSVQASPDRQTPTHRRSERGHRLLPSPKEHVAIHCSLLERFNQVIIIPLALQKGGDAKLLTNDEVFHILLFQTWSMASFVRGGVSG